MLLNENVIETFDTHPLAQIIPSGRFSVNDEFQIWAIKTCHYFQRIWKTERLTNVVAYLCRCCGCHCQKRNIRNDISNDSQLSICRPKIIAPLADTMANKKKNSLHCQCFPIIMKSKCSQIIFKITQYYLSVGFQIPETMCKME